MKSNILFSIILLFFTSCGFIVFKVIGKNNNAGPLDTEGRDDIESPYNLDNIIFMTNRRFTYEVDQRWKNRNLKFNLELIILPGTFNLQETKIKYVYQYNPKDLTEAELKDFGYSEQNTYLPEYTSLTEEKGNIQLHPPRTKTLICLQKAPFPKLPYPLHKGSKRKGMLYIPKGNWAELEGSMIKWNYVIDSISLKEKTTPYYCRVQAKAISKKGGCNELEMHFTADSGFTKLFYRFEDQTTVDFILKEIR